METLRFALAVVAYIILVLGVVVLLSSVITGGATFFASLGMIAISAILIALHKYTGRGRL